jgi:hypothetical protein
VCKGLQSTENAWKIQRLFETCYLPTKCQGFKKYIWSILRKKIQRINGQLSAKGLETSQIVQGQELEGFSN